MLFKIVLFEIKILFDWVMVGEQKVHKFILYFICLIILALLIVMRLKVCWLNNVMMAFPFYYVGVKYRNYIYKVVLCFAGRYWVIILLFCVTILLI